MIACLNVILKDISNERLSKKPEQLTGESDIEAFIRREVLPYTPDAWIKEDATKIGYEVSFTRHFYKPQPLRTLDEIAADILAIENEAEGLTNILLGNAR